MRFLLALVLLGVLAMHAPGLVLAQGAPLPPQLAERIRSDIVREVSSLFPGNRVVTALRPPFARVEVALETSQQELPPQPREILLTILRLSEDIVRQRAPQLRLAPESSFRLTAASGSSVVLRASEALTGSPAQAPPPAASSPRPTSEPTGAPTANRPRPAGTAGTAGTAGPPEEGGAAIVLSVPGGEKPLVVRLSAATTRALRRGDGGPLIAELARNLSLPPDSKALRDNVEIMAARYGSNPGPVLHHLWEGELPAAPPAAAVRTPKEQWEKSRVQKPEPPPPPPPTHWPPPHVAGDLVDLQSGDLVPKGKVQTRARSFWRDVDGSAYSNLQDAEIRGTQADLRVGLSRQLEADITVLFTNIDLRQGPAGTFDSLSSDQSALGLGFRYRIPEYTHLWSTTIGFRTGVLRTAKKQFLLPDDQLQLNHAYITLTRGYGRAGLAHFTYRRSFLEQPTPFTEVKMDTLGAAYENRFFGNRYRYFAEVYHNSFDRQAIGKLGTVIGDEGLNTVLGLRISSRLGTFDVYGKKLFAEGVSESGIVFHRKL